MKNELLEVAKSYIKENCNKVGKVKGSNLSENQENAIKSLTSWGWAVPSSAPALISFSVA